MLGQLQHCFQSYKIDYFRSLLLLDGDKAKMKLVFNYFSLKYLSVAGNSKLLKYL